MILKLAFTMTTFLFINPASAEIKSYAELQLKDYHEMNEVVSKHILQSDTYRTSDTEENPTQKATEELRSALQYVLARPNRDNMIVKFFPTLSSKLRTLNSFEDTLLSIASESLFAIEKGKQKARVRASHVFILLNLMSEIKPMIKQNPGLVTVYKKISDTKIKIPEDIAKNLRLNMYAKLPSPSTVAEEVLEELQPKK